MPTNGGTFQIQSGVPFVVTRPDDRRFVAVALANLSSLVLDLQYGSESQSLPPARVSVIPASQSGAPLRITPASGGTDGQLLVTWYTPDDDALLRSLGSSVALAPTGSVPTNSTITSGTVTVTSVEDPVTVAGITDPVTLTQPVDVSATTGSVSDASGSITTASTSQVILGEAARKFLLISNLSSTDTLYIAFTIAASSGAGSIPVASGATLVFDKTFVPNSQVSGYALTAGVAFTCYWA